MHTVILRTVGESVIEVGERTVVPSASHLFALMLYLAAESPRRVSRAFLSDLLFRNEKRTAATHNLRQLLYRLRRIEAPLVSCVEGERFDHLHVFDSADQQLAKPYPDRAFPPTRSFAVLPDYVPPTAAFAEWVEKYRDRQRRRLVHSLSDDLAIARRAGDWAALEALASALLEIEPYHESATLCFAEALARTGSKHRAVALLQQYEEDAGRTTPTLALPPQLLKKRIVSSAPRGVGEIPRVPLLGRNAEMHRLGEHWAHAIAGNVSLVLVTGERSIGKTRLVSEFLSLVRLDGSGTIVASRRLATDRQRPLSLFADVTKQLMCLPGSAGCAPEHVPLLLALTEAPRPDRPAEAAVTADTERGMRIALGDLLDCVSSEKPLLLSVEDAHFLDDASLSLLEQLTDCSPALPLLVLMAGECVSAPIRRVSRVRLDPLDREHLGLLFDRYAKERALNATQFERDWYCAVAAGNPGHLELLITSEGTTTGKRIPMTLLALTDERIASLSVRAKHTLCAIAVIDGECSVDTVAAVTGLGAYAALRALEEIESAFLVISGPGGLRCRSSLIQERILACTASSVKQLLHARTARVIHGAFRSRAFSQAASWRIAEHWLAAGNLGRARRWQRRCWRHSTSIGQPAMAAASIREALLGTQTPKERAVLLDDLANALRSAADTGGLVTVLRERSTLCDQCDDATSTRTALAFDLVDASLRNYDDDAQHLSELRSLVMSGELDSARRIRAVRSLLISAHNMLDPLLAAEAHEINLQLRPPDRASELFQRSALMIYETVFGDRREAMREAEALADIAKRSTLLWERMSAVLNVSLSRWIVSPSPLDISATAEGFEQARRGNSPVLALHLASQVANFLCEDGQLEEGRNWAQRAEEIATLHRLQRVPMDYLSVQANYSILSGDADSANRWIGQMPVMSPKARSGMSENAVFAFQILRKLVCLGDEVSETEIERLRSYHRLARAYGRHDYHMQALWLALRASGRATEAHNSLTEYITSLRRELRPPDRMLIDRTAADELWTTVSTPTSTIAVSTD